jgi:hypothetical protein
MRKLVTGAIILLVAIAICWGLVAVGQARGGDWIAALIGPERAQTDAPMVETLFYLLIFGSLILVAMIAAAFERRNAAALGRRPAAALLLGLFAGFAGLTVSVLYASLAGTLTDGAVNAAVPAVLLWGLAVIALQTAAEEIYFRGWLQPALTARWGEVAGIAAAALAFAALHVAGGAREPISLINLFLGGLMFGLFAARGGGIAAALAAHFAWNAAEQLLYGLDPNPGLGSFGALYDKELVGAPIWGGSDQGLNGSIGMTIALLAILIPLALLGRRRADPAVPPVLSPSVQPG